MENEQIALINEAFTLTTDIYISPHTHIKPELRMRIAEWQAKVVEARDKAAYAKLRNEAGS